MTSYPNPQATNPSPRPAYKEKWFWFIMSPLITVWIACSITITIAVTNAPDIVIGDYYKEGLLINDRSEQLRNAKALGVQGQLHIDQELGELLLTLSSRESSSRESSSRESSSRESSSRESIPNVSPAPVLTEALHLKLYHPAFSDRDFTVHLRKTTAVDDVVSYVGEISNPLAGRWYWQLSPATNVDSPKQSSSLQAAPLQQQWQLAGEIDFTDLQWIDLAPR